MCLLPFYYRSPQASSFHISTVTDWFIDRGVHPPYPSLTTSSAQPLPTAAAAGNATTSTSADQTAYKEYVVRVSLICHYLQGGQID